MLVLTVVLVAVVVVVVVVVEEQFRCTYERKRKQWVDCTCMQDEGGDGKQPLWSDIKAMYV